MKVSALSYRKIAEDLGVSLCTSAEGCAQGYSQNVHYRGAVLDGTAHWSRADQRVRRAGLYRLLYAYQLSLVDEWADMFPDDWLEYHSASVLAVRSAMELYRIRIPSSATRTERRRLLAAARHINLRTKYPRTYAWATYKES